MAVCHLSRCCPMPSSLTSRRSVPMDDSWASVPERASCCTIRASTRQPAAFQPLGQLTFHRMRTWAKSRSVPTVGLLFISPAYSPAAIGITGAAVLRAKSFSPTLAPASLLAAHKVRGRLRLVMYGRMRQRRMVDSFIPPSALMGASSPSTQTIEMYGSSTPSTAHPRTACLPPPWCLWPVTAPRRTQTASVAALAPAAGMSPSSLPQLILCQAPPYLVFCGSTCVICALERPLGASQQPRQFPSQETEQPQTTLPSVPMDGTSPSRRGPPTWCPETPTEHRISSCAILAPVFHSAAPLPLCEFLSLWTALKGTVARVDR